MKNNISNNAQSKNMDITIREGERADLPAVLSLYAQLGEDDGAVLSPEDAEYIFERMRTYPYCRLYVALVESRVVGTFTMLVMDNLAHMGASSAIIEDVVVEKEFRGKGVGRRMMEFAYEICQEKGCYKIALTSNRNRKDAHRFYESLGFEMHGYSFSITFSENISHSV